MDSVLVEDFERIVHSDINFQDMKNSSFLITGATGLLGSLLVKFLLYCNENYDFNFHVYALVRNIKKANEVFKDELDNKNLCIVAADLLNDTCEFSFYSDYVIHTAAVTTSKQMVEQPVETIFTSIYGLNKQNIQLNGALSQQVIFEGEDQLPPDENQVDNEGNEV